MLLMKEKKADKYPPIFYDVAGIACLICVPLIGWIPGPGGMPLLYLSLRLLGKNHKFPRDITNYLEEHGSKILDAVFPDIKVIMMAWDIVIVAVIAGAIFVGNGVTGPFTVFGLNIPEEIIISLSISVALFSFLAFLRNRRRWESIRKKMGKG